MAEFPSGKVVVCDNGTGVSEIEIFVFVQILVVNEINGCNL